MSKSPDLAALVARIRESDAQKEQARRDAAQELGQSTDVGRAILADAWLEDSEKTYLLESYGRQLVRILERQELDKKFSRMEEQGRKLDR